MGLDECLDVMCKNRELLWGNSGSLGRGGGLAGNVRMFYINLKSEGNGQGSVELVC